VVIGYGNTLRRDDGVGWYIATALAECWGERLTVLVGQQPVPEWVETLADADVVFIVDAVLAAQRIRLRRLRPAADTAALEGHCFRPEQLLRLVGTLYGRTPKMYVLAVPTADLGFGEGLSAATAHAAERAVRLLDRRVAGMTGGTRSRRLPSFAGSIQTG
jgi:hydrogenase maturation protease